MKIMRLKEEVKREKMKAREKMQRLKLELEKKEAENHLLKDGEKRLNVSKSTNCEKLYIFVYSRNTLQIKKILFE